MSFRPLSNESLPAEYVYHIWNNSKKVNDPEKVKKVTGPRAFPVLLILLIFLLEIFISFVRFWSQKLPNLTVENRRIHKTRDTKTYTFAFRLQSTETKKNEKQVIKRRWKLPQDETCSTRAGKLRNYQKVLFNWIRATLSTVNLLFCVFSVKAKVSYFWTFNSDRSRPPINKTLISWPSDLGGVRESTEIDLVSYLRKITALSLIFYCKTVPLQNVALI